MQTLMIELTGEEFLKALQNLERRQLIKIVGRNSYPDSLALPGEPVSNEYFKKCAEYSESS